VSIMETKLENKEPASTASREAGISAILKQMAKVLRNMRTYQPNNPVLQKSLITLLNRLTAYVERHESLTLLVRENELIYGSNVVYSNEDKLESLAFALYRDGIRLISFRDGLSRAELYDFMSALHEAREADPYQADLVTILWEKDLASISYRAVDAYLEDDERKSIEEIAQRCETQPIARPRGDTVPGTEFFLKELGLSLEHRTASARRRPQKAREADIQKITHEILEENDQSILKTCSQICLETLNLAPRDDTFDRVTDFVGKICDWHVSAGDYLSACSILSDLRALLDGDALTTPRKSSITDTIAKLGDRRKIAQIGEQLADLSEQRLEEIYAYLTLMSPDAIGPLCNILAECEARKVRYLLCRAISVIAKNEPAQLRHFIQDDRWYFVRNVVMILGMMGNNAGVGLLRQATSHPEARVRREVARSIGKIRSAKGLDVLRTLLDDENKMVRFASLSAMREIDATEARDFLEAMVIDKSFSRKSMDEKREVMRTYGNLGKPGFGFLEAIVSGRFKHMDEETRAAAVYGIAMMNDRESAEYIREVIEESDGQVKRAAVEAITTMTLFEL
jgi:HEAT repeat protein